jgi:hypothetical protein
MRNIGAIKQMLSLVSDSRRVHEILDHHLSFGRHAATFPSVMGLQDSCGTEFDVTVLGRSVREVI